MGSSHHGSMPADDCGHCPDTTSTPDELCTMVAAGDCLSQGRAMVERRLVDDPQPQAAPPPAFLHFDAPTPAIGSPTEPRIRPTPVSRASVQQRYCTYLK